MKKPLATTAKQMRAAQSREAAFKKLPRTRKPRGKTFIQKMCAQVGCSGTAPMREPSDPPRDRMTIEARAEAYKSGDIGKYGEAGSYALKKGFFDDRL